MDSIGKECTQLKNQYDVCFNKWYSDIFLKGGVQSTHPCQDLFEEYRACVVVAVKEKKLEKALADARFKDGTKR